MTDVKRMASTEDFLQMPLEYRNCEVELYDDCRTRRLLEKCDCVPWDVPHFQVGIQKGDCRDALKRVKVNYAVSEKEDGVTGVSTATRMTG